MDKYYSSISQFFQEIFSPLRCEEESTKAYIISIYSKFINSNQDLSNYSITILYSQAKTNQQFDKFQNIGDWIFFANTIMPSFLKNASQDYYETIGRLSYYSCYNLINKKWKLFEELADNFSNLKKQTKKIIKNNNIFI